MLKSLKTAMLILSIFALTACSTYPDWVPEWAQL